MCSEETVTLHSVFGQRYEPIDKPKTVGSYVLGRILGEGKCSLVREGINEDNQRKVAVKTLLKYRSKTGDIQRLCFRREVDSLRRLRHPNVITLYETMETSRFMYLVLELVEGKTLAELLKQRKYLHEDEAQLITKQLASAVNYVHLCGIIHRDIKPANILIQRKDDRIKLIDFGLSAVNIPPGCAQTRQCGTPYYSAPEIYSGTSYGPPVDVWSLGVILYETLTGRTPFVCEGRTKNLPQLYGSILRAVVITSSISRDCAKLVKSLLSYNPDNRPTSQELLSHIWVSTAGSTQGSDNLSDTDSCKDLDLTRLATEGNKQHKECHSVRLYHERKKNEKEVMTDR